MIPYGYPKLDCTPSVQIEDRPDDIHAFRVDIDTSVEDIGNKVAERLTELKPSRSDKITAQFKPSFTAGYVLVGPLCFTVENSHSVALRLYRPGFELVEVKPWEQIDRVDWKPAPDLSAQVKCLDQLVRHVVNPGPMSAANRAALNFGADEYERLATMAESQEQRGRLTEKADLLRKRAAVP